MRSSPTRFNSPPIIAISGLGNTSTTPCVLTKALATLPHSSSLPNTNPFPRGKVSLTTGRVQTVA